MQRTVASDQLCNSNGLLNSHLARCFIAQYSLLNILFQARPLDLLRLVRLNSLVRRVLLFLLLLLLLLLFLFRLPPPPNAQDEDCERHRDNKIDPQIFRSLQMSACGTRVDTEKVHTEERLAAERQSLQWD